MRIGVFDPYLDTLGGGEKYMLTAVVCLSEENDVSLFWDKKDILLHAKERFGLDLSKVKVVGNIFSKKFGISRRLLESRNYDVVIYLSDGSIPILFSKKLIIHFQFPVEWVREDSIKTRLKLARVAKIICNSNFTKHYIDKKFEVDSIVVYPPVVINLKGGKTKKENMILHVGRLQERVIEGSNFKKQDVMIDVFKKMIDNGLSDWRFVIAVSIQENDKRAFLVLRRRAEGYPIDFLVNLENSKLWENYWKAKIYWHATGFGEDLEKNPELAEHFGISTVEAMGAGAVPVVINAGGQKEIIENGVNGFLWKGLSELQEKTLELINNEKLWEKMSKSAKKRAEFFAGDRFCREISKLTRK